MLLALGIHGLGDSVEDLGMQDMRISTWEGDDLDTGE